MYLYLALRKQVVGCFGLSFSTKDKVFQTDEGK